MKAPEPISLRVLNQNYRALWRRTKRESLEVHVLYFLSLDLVYIFHAALPRQWHGAQAIVENSRYFIIEGRSQNEASLRQDIFIDDVEVREHNSASLTCSWVTNPGKCTCSVSL